MAKEEVIICFGCTVNTPIHIMDNDFICGSNFGYCIRYAERQILIKEYREKNGKEKNKNITK